MPIKHETELQEDARRKFPHDKERQGRYVYGTLRHKFGWKPKQPKG